MPFIVVIYKTPIIQITFEIFMKHSSHIERWIKKKLNLSTQNGEFNALWEKNVSLIHNAKVSWKPNSCQ